MRISQNGRLLLGAFASAVLLVAESPWAHPDLPYRLRVEVPSVATPNTPVVAHLDLDKYLHDAGIDAAPDGRSLRIIETSEGGEPSTAVAGHVGDSLLNDGAGSLSWVVRRPGSQTFHVYFGTVAGARAPFTRYQEPVGAGDAFRYNRPGGLDPLGVGMTNDQPMPVDWDGDGRTDLLQRNIYSYTYGEPYWGLFFWRNIGSDVAPELDHYVRLRADGYLQDRYATYQLMDWNRDGRPDVVAGTGRSGEQAALQVYLQTGRRDGYGLPVLTRGPRVDVTGGGRLWYGMRLLDWNADGRVDLFTLRSKVLYFPTPQVNYTWYRHANRAEPDQEPRFGPGEPLSLYGQSVYPDRPNDFIDWDGDGDLDLVGVTGDLQSNPPAPSIVVRHNTRTRRSPSFGWPPMWIDNPRPGTQPLPTVVPTGPWQGLLVGYMGSWLRRLVTKPAGLSATVTDVGLLKARGQAVSSGGYNSAEVADWEGDGDLDFISGNEKGFLHLIENISDKGRTMFRSPRLVRLADGQPLHVARWQFIDDHDPEWNLGQSKPTYVDWDADGDLDLLVGNNSNRVAYFENIGIRESPRFSGMRKLTYGAGGEHYSFRKRPAVVDWNADGLLDLVEADAGVREKVNPKGRDAVSLYLRYRDEQGRLRLQPPTPFRFTDGKPFELEIPYRHGFEVADWDGDGDWDILTNERFKLYVYANAGSNAEPRFARREALTMHGEPIEISHHETSVKVIDWDGDGVRDLIAGAESGWVYFFRGQVLDQAAPPAVRVGSLELRAGAVKK